MPATQKNTIHTVRIEGCSSSGDGVAHIDGRAVFVRGALRGELCDVRILKESKKLLYAKIERILEPSPHRKEPDCPNFGKCGGCDLMHMDYDEELDIKRQRVQDALRRIGGLDIDVPVIVGADNPSRYRNKAIYAVDKVGGKAITGFYRARSHDVVPAEQCLIQAEISDRAALAVRQWMDECGVSAYDEVTRRGAVRHVFCRYAFTTGQAQVTLVTAEGGLESLDRLVDSILRHCPETRSIILNVNKTHGNTVLAGEFRTLWGDDYIEDELSGLRFALSTRSFYQINHAQAERLYSCAVDLAGLTGAETVLDLYCGTGTITLLLAQRAARAIGAEIVEAAIADARENAARNGITNAEFICADASDAAKALHAQEVTPDVVVVDPPRKGLAPDVIETIAGMSPGRIVYVSCDPGTLARDLKLFTALGYTASNATAFDMFPQCSHVETVVLMTRTKQ